MYASKGFPIGLIGRLLDGNSGSEPVSSSFLFQRVVYSRGKVMFIRGLAEKNSSWSSNSVDRSQVPSRGDFIAVLAEVVYHVSASSFGAWADAARLVELVSTLKKGDLGTVNSGE